LSKRPERAAQAARPYPLFYFLCLIALILCIAVFAYALYYVLVAASAAAFNLLLYFYFASILFMLLLPIVVFAFLLFLKGRRRSGLINSAFILLFVFIALATYIVCSSFGLFEGGYYFIVCYAIVLLCLICLSTTLIGRAKKKKLHPVTLSLSRASAILLIIVPLPFYYLFSAIGSEFSLFGSISILQLAFAIIPLFIQIILCTVLYRCFNESFYEGFIRQNPRLLYAKKTLSGA